MTATPREIVLEARDLVCRRGRGRDRFELRVDALDLAAGEVLVVLGPNGAGKSTLLRALAGLEDAATEGRITCAEGRRTMVFQRPAAFAGSVAFNLGCALLGQGLSRAERRRRVAAALARFDIEPLAAHRASTLSGGELRRLALARAFVLEPQVLLLDEPFDDLDAEGQRRLTADLQTAIEESRVATVMVTHDLRRALLMADRIAVIDGGRMVQSGEKDAVLHRPRNPRVAELVGMTNLATGRVCRREGELAWIEIAEGFEIPTAATLDVGQAVWVGIRPEHLKVDVGRGDGQPIGKAQVERLVSDGLATVVSLRVQARAFTTHLLSGRGLARRLRVGDPVSLAVDPAHVHARPLDAGPDRDPDSGEPASHRQD